MISKVIKQVDYSLLDMVSDCHVRMTIRSNLNIIADLNVEIKIIENKLKHATALKPEFQSLTTIDGIGKIPGMTIMLETGDISRFKKVGNFSSYARCVDSTRSWASNEAGALLNPSNS